MAAMGAAAPVHSFQAASSPHRQTYKKKKKNIKSKHRTK